MNQYARNIRAAVSREIECATAAQNRQQADQAFRHLERAHVLGQHSTREHVRVHILMLRWGWRHRSPREVLGQLLRIVGAATKTAIGWVPTGNTGGAKVSAFRPMPIDPELHAIMIDARRSPSP